MKKIGAAIIATAVIGVAVITLGIARVVAGTDPRGTAAVRDAAGTRLGNVTFTSRRGLTEVRIQLTLDVSKVAADAHHGIHIHANGDPANGVGCVADSAKEAATWFVSADGHWKADGQDHSGHIGDLGSVYVTSDGRVDARFLTSRVDRSALVGKAVVVHAGPDNFGNVPVGTAVNQYTANGTDATTLTKNTGNAGARIGCGVIGS